MSQESRATAIQALIEQLKALTPHWTTEGNYLVPIPLHVQQTYRDFGWCRWKDVRTIADELAALLLREGPPQEDYEAALAVLPDSLERPLAARIGIVLASLKRESHIGCELRRELDSGIERDAKAIEKQWPAAAAFLRSHAHIEDGV